LGRTSSDARGTQIRQPEQAKQMSHNLLDSKKEKWLKTPPLHKMFFFLPEIRKSLPWAANLKEVNSVQFSFKSKSSVNYKAR
jgi:hypothetical protein